jgi:hypothetical protein
MAEQRPDQIGAGEECVKVPAGPARGEGMVRRVDEIRANFEALDVKTTAAKGAIRPQATVVLPTPELVPAITTRAVMQPVPQLPLDPLLGADALVHGVLYLGHL